MNRDYILIRDGDSPMSRPIARLTGKSEDNPTVIMSTGSNLYLYLKTSLGDSRRGFSIRYTQGCKATIIARNGTVQSPSFGLNDYPNNQECLYRVKNPQGGPLSLKFISFNVHKTDFVQVTENFYKIEREERAIFSRRIDFDRCTMARIPTVSVCILEAVSHRTRGRRSLWLRRVERCWSDSPLMRFIAALAGKQSSQQVLLTNWVSTFDCF